MVRCILIGWAVTAAWPAALLGAQGVPSGSLELVSTGGASSTLTVADLGGLPPAEVTVSEGGASSTFVGAKLRDLLTRAGAPTGRSLRGPAMSLVVLAEAADGYTVAFSVGEIDPQFGNRAAIVAWRRNGEALDVRDGPLQLVLPEDEFHARWVRQLVRLRLVQLPGGTALAPHG